MQLIRKGEAAEILGISNGRISQLLTSGALCEVPGTKMLDREAVLAFRRKGNVKMQIPGAKSGRPPAAKQAAASGRQLKKKIDQLPDDAIPELNESRARREHYQAELAKLEVDHRRNELVAADAVKKEAFSVAKTVREALINIPDRVANLLAAESDATAIHMTLTEEITQALQGLANA
jgi:hypothetical protein